MILNREEQFRLFKLCYEGGGTEDTIESSFGCSMRLLPDSYHILKFVRFSITVSRVEENEYLGYQRIH